MSLPPPKTGIVGFFTVLTLASGLIVGVVVTVAGSWKMVWLPLLYVALGINLLVSIHRRRVRISKR